MEMADTTCTTGWAYGWQAFTWILQTAFIWEMEKRLFLPGLQMSRGKRQTKLQMQMSRRLKIRIAMFSCQINAIPDCALSTTIPAGKAAISIPI